AKNVGNPSPQKQFTSETQGLCPGPGLDVHRLKAVLWHQIKDLEEMGHQPDDEAGSRAIGDNYVGILELRTEPADWAAVRFPRKQMDGVGCGDQAGERGGYQRLVNRPGATN